MLTNEILCNSRRHPLIEKTCVVVPSAAHVSFTEAVTVLWLGRNNLVKVAVDDESRMSSSGKSKGRLDVYIGFSITNYLFVSILVRPVCRNLTFMTVIKRMIRLTSNQHYK